MVFDMHIGFKILLEKIGVLFFISIIFTACASQNPAYRNLTRKPVSVIETPSRVSQASSTVSQIDDEIDYFREIVLGSEYGLGALTVKKWRRNIRIEVSGHPTLQDLATLQRVITDLNNIIAPKIQIELTHGNGNVKLMFIPHDEFYQYEPPGIIFYGGFFRTWWHPTGEIYKGCVVIGSDHVDQHHRSHLIREELTQTLGLMNDSMKFKDSIFYQGNSEVTSFSSLDKRVIKRLYSSDIHAGMNSDQLYNALNK